MHVTGKWAIIASHIRRQVILYQILNNNHLTMTMTIKSNLLSWFTASVFSIKYIWIVQDTDNYKHIHFHQVHRNHTGYIHILRIHTIVNNSIYVKSKPHFDLLEPVREVIVSKIVTISVQVNMNYNKPWMTCHCLIAELSGATLLYYIFALRYMNFNCLRCAMRYSQLVEIWSNKFQSAPFYINNATLYVYNTAPH